MHRPLALLLIAAGLVGGCVSGEPEPVVVRFTLDDTGTPACSVGPETHYLTDDERRQIANALIAEYAPDYCSAE